MKNGSIKVEKIDTKLQNADYLTKGLPHETYHENRKRVQGWLVSLNGKPQFFLDPPHCESLNLSPSERESQDTAAANLADPSHTSDNRKSAMRASAKDSTEELPKDPAASQEHKNSNKMFKIPDKTLIDVS